MWLSMNILSKMVDLTGIAPEDIANRLTMSTAEIESFEFMNPFLRDVITAKVLNVLPHPKADKLSLVDIDTSREKITVVCGAPNQKKDDIVAFAPVGTVFSKEFTIKKAVIRGVESTGMLCSERELGLSDDHSGIMILPASTPLGMTLQSLYPDWVDVRFEIDNKSITHRPDLWSHAGFARELGALFKRDVRDVINRDLLKELPDAAPVSVSIEDAEASSRYSGLVLKNIAIAESPQWLKANVTAIGMRPINNIVDVTNYVMAEVGEPMHAFDQVKLRGRAIIVRMAGKNESITTLDGKDFALNTEDIVIADKGGAVALAGVMGGANSEIEWATKEIVLEAANFNPVLIRKTAQRYNQRTEAAIRFEKSLSPELTVAALLRCYEIIKSMIPGVQAVSKIIDVYPKEQKPVTIETTTGFIRSRLGQAIDDAEIIRILVSLDFTVTAKDGRLTVGVPQYRATKDISIPEDIVEEVGRIFGYGNIKPAAPAVPCTAPVKNDFRMFERQVKGALARDMGMIEVSGYSFLGKDILDKLGVNEDKELRLANPLSVEMDRLRRSIVPNIISAISLNQRYHESFQIFEQGRVYIKDNRKSSDLVVERTMAAGSIYRKKTSSPVFYAAKNTVLALLSRLRIGGVTIVPATSDLPPYCHPGRSALVMIKKEQAGMIFELHPDAKGTFDITGQTALFEIDLDVLYSAEKKGMQFNELQKYPEVPFEVSVLADSTTYADDILTIIRGCDAKVRSADVITIYEGERLPQGKKSVSIKTVFYSDEKTLSPEEVSSLQQKVISSLNKKGFNLR